MININRDESPKTVDTLQLEIPAAFPYLSIIGACISGLLESELSLSDKEATSYNIELAVHEACTNIIEHAYAGVTGRIKLIFTLWENPIKIVIELFDNGRSFDFSSMPMPDLNEPQIRGYGLFLMRELMDAVEYCVKVDGNYWRMTKNLEQRGSSGTSLSRRRNT